MDFEYLREFVNPDSERETRVLDALKSSGGNQEEAWRQSGLDGGNSRQVIRRLKKRASHKIIKHGDGIQETTDEGYSVKGTSRLYDEAGNLKIQWVKTDRDKEQEEQAFKDFINGLCEEIEPVKPRKAGKAKQYNKDLMCGIFIGDSHIGMKAHGTETKHSNFDTNIGTKNTRDAIDDLIFRAPNAEVGLLVDVGDFMHSNGSSDTTLKGTKVDVDTRHSVVMGEAGRLMKYCIDRMLSKFKRVVVVVARGNHNADPAIGVQLILEAFFHQEPRVSVLKTEGYFHYLEWGKWLIGVNHGDKVKPAKLASIMARDMPQAWGRTSHRMWALGHFHHQDVLEVDGCIVQKFAALPPPDSWHASMGFSSGQAMQMINFKKDGGRHSTLIYELPKPEIQPDIRIK